MPGDRPEPGEGRLAVTEQPDTLAATGRVERVSLNVVAQQDGASFHERMAEREQDLREKMVDRVMPVFFQANRWTLIALGILALVDEINILGRVIPPGSRVITQQVVMALLGATTVQVGAIAVIIAQYLFPGRPRSSS